MVITISVAVIAALFFVITVFIVAASVRAFKAFGEAQKLLEAARFQLAPVTHDLTQILSSVRTIARSAENQLDKVSESVNAVRDTARNIREFEALIQERIERPLLDITAVLSALLKGGKVFWNNVRKR
jgi:uncharacterized protein YoxC